MKKITLFLALILGLAQTAQSQSELDNLVTKKFDTWSLGFHVSANNYDGDASDGKSSFSIFSPKFGYGLTLSKQFSHFMSFEVNYETGSLGSDYSPYRFNSNFDQIDGRIRLNFTNGQILKNYSKTQIYGFTGFGMFRFKTTSDNMVGVKEDWVHVVPFGVGFKKKLSNRTSMNLEMGYNKVNTDLLDGVKVAGSERDGYTDLRIGFQYTFGKKKKPLEWDEALSYFKPLAEHSVDTLVIIQKEISVIGDTAKKVVNELNIYYDIDDYLINGIYREDMHIILAQLQENPNDWIDVYAFCDSTGTQEKNSKLVLKRSRLVKDFFVNNGIFHERINVYNYGMEFAKNEILSKDRRVTIKYHKGFVDKFK